MLLNCGVGEGCWESLEPARRSNQSILKEISPEYSLEGLMLKLKLQYSGHLMRRTDSFEKTLMLGNMKVRGEGGDRGWNGQIGITDWMDMSLGKLQELVMDREAWHAAVYGVAKSQTRLSDWTELNCPKLVLRSLHPFLELFPRPWFLLTTWAAGVLVSSLHVVLVQPSVMLSGLCPHITVTHPKGVCITSRLTGDIAWNLLIGGGRLVFFHFLHFKPPKVYVWSCWELFSLIWGEKFSHVKEKGILIETQWDREREREGGERVKRKRCQVRWTYLRFWHKEERREEEKSTFYPFQWVCIFCPRVMVPGILLSILWVTPASFSSIVLLLVLNLVVSNSCSPIEV